MKRREFLSLLGAASTMPVAAVIGTSSDSLDINDTVIPEVTVPTIDLPNAEVATTQQVKLTDIPAEDYLDYLKVDPMEISLGTDLFALVEPKGDLLGRIHRLRKEIAAEIGIILPKVRVRDSIALEKMEYEIRIDDQTVAKWHLLPDCYLALPGDNVTEKVHGIETIEPAYGTPALWVNEANKEYAKKYGYTVVEPNAVLATHLLEVVRRHADEILTLDMTAHLFDTLQETSPIAAECFRPIVTKIHPVLQLLLREQVPIRQLETIFGVLVEHVPQTQDPILLTTFVRRRLARTICNRYRDENNTLHVVMLDPTLEDLIRAGFEHGRDGGLFIRMSPQAIDVLCKKILTEVNKLTALNYPAVVLVEPRIRAALKYMTLTTLPGLVVLSLAEITSDTKVSSYGIVTLNNDDLSSAVQPLPDTPKETLGALKTRLQKISQNLQRIESEYRND